MKIVFLVVAAAFLITIFAFWGMDIDSSQIGANVAFSVNGEDISIRAYEDLVSRYLQQYSGQEVSEELRRQIRKQAADELIGEKLLEQTSKKMGINIMKDELFGSVRQVFPNDQVYNEYVQRAPPAWWQNLEEMTERNIRVSRARSPFMDAVWVSDSEWAKIMADLYQEADVSHMLFKPVSEVGDSEVEDYYARNRARILNPTKVRPRQILFKVAEDAPETEVKPVLDETKRVLDLAKAGKDFEALARRFSQAPDAEDGGDMGYQEPGDLVEQVDNVVFGMSPGQISEPVRTEFGFHIFKLEEKIPASIKPLTPELTDELRPSAITDTHWEAAKERGARVLEAAQKFPEQFDLLARLHSQAPSGRKAGRVGWIPRLVFPTGFDATHLLGEVSSGAAIDRDVSRSAFEVPAGQIAPTLIRSAFGWHILKVHDRRAISGTPPTDTDIGVVRASYLRLLREESLIRWVQEERKKANIKFKIDIES